MVDKKLRKYSMRNLMKNPFIVKLHKCRTFIQLIKMDSNKIIKMINHKEKVISKKVRRNKIVDSKIN